MAEILRDIFYKKKMENHLEKDAMIELLDIGRKCL